MSSELLFAATIALATASLVAMWWTSRKQARTVPVPRQKRHGAGNALVLAVALAGAIGALVPILIRPAQQPGYGDAMPTAVSRDEVSRDLRARCRDDLCNGVVGPGVQAGLSDDVIEEQLRGPEDPQPPGPWPFVVLFDQGQGIFIRSSPGREATRIGLAPHASVVWVECVARSDFDPEPGLNYGAYWYRVRWPNTAPSEAFGVSTPSDPAQGWAYAYYLRPSGTNGNVPACS